MGTPRKIFALLFFCLNPATFIYAQSSSDSVSIVESEKIFTIVEVMPEFPGGNDSMLQFISDNLKFQLEPQVRTRVYVSFIVQADGSLKDAKVLRGIDSRCDEEALRVVRTMPNWKPGMQNGKAVQVIFNLPVEFSKDKIVKKKRK